MNQLPTADWKRRIVSVEKALSKIEPGMRIFIGTGVVEPRTLVRRLVSPEFRSPKDLELIQLVSLETAISPEALDTGGFRLKTFVSSRAAAASVSAGRVDLVPCRFSAIPRHIRSGRIPVDAALIQITPPDDAGWCSMGPAVDIAGEVMEKVSLTIGEIQPGLPRTSGDTHVRIDAFDRLVMAEIDPYHFGRWHADAVTDRLAARAAAVIQDGSCIACSFGPFFEALGKHLSEKRDLGIHTPFFTDALMDLVNCGAVTNHRKKSFPGVSTAAYAVGTPELTAWLHDNPMVEFHGIETMFSPVEIARNPNVVAVLTAGAADLSGNIALPTGRRAVAPGPEEAPDLIDGAALSPGGLALFALPSRDPSGAANIRVSLEEHSTPGGFRESVDLVVTEYGVASLGARTLRERAQALIDIAHPEDRQALFEQAKAGKILYPDQIFLAECAAVYPSDIDVTRTFKNGTTVRFRAIRPSDEEEMRRLFYRFSDEAVYYRYFSPIRSMPHREMQTYVNVDCAVALSVVGITGPPGDERIIAEARYVRDHFQPTADVAFVVDDAFQRTGIGSFLLDLLVRLARERGVHTFTADVLAVNRGMMTVFERSGLPMDARFMDGAYALTLRLDGGS